MRRDQSGDGEMEGQLSLFPEEEKPSVKQGKRREKNAIVPDLSQTFDERMKRFLHYMEFKSMDERWIETAEGELRIVIDALADYHDIASKKTEAMEMGYVRAVWEDRLERIKKIQTKLEESVGYVRDKQLEICRKKRAAKNNDIGEDALLILLKRGESAKKNNDAAKGKRSLEQQERGDDGT